MRPPPRLSLMVWLLLAAALTSCGSAVSRAATHRVGAPGTYSFVSAPHLHPPVLQVLVRRAGLAPGHLMITDDPTVANRSSTAPDGPELLDNSALPVWFLPTGGPTFNLEQQTYDGQPVLVWFQMAHRVTGRVNPVPTRSNPGEIVVMNEHYRRIATVRGHAPWLADLHDASIVGHDIWITVARPVQHYNLSPYGGPRNGRVQDVGLQDFDLRTGRLIQTWDALNPHGAVNVPLRASHERPTQSWDAYHQNSVQALPNGDLLVSMRNTWSVYLINPVRRRILWTLGGKDSTFHVPADARFAWQHDARLIHPSGGGQGPDVELTLFDNNSYRGPARGLVLRLNTATRRASLVAAYAHHPPYRADFLGSMQVLPNGNALVGWGSPAPYFTEFSRGGSELLNVGWPHYGQSYRTLFTDTWVGRPYYPPSGALRGGTVYASWNGATQVARWEVLAGAAARSLSVVASQARAGFETAIRLSRTYAVYEVRALSAAGAPLRTSQPFSGAPPG
jgi:hypothetical protein